MATCLDIITDAMKLATILPSGGVPSSAETADGLVCLQSMYDEFLNGGMFGTLKDYTLTEDTDAQEGYRYYVPAGFTLTAATNDYTPQYPDSYSDCDYGGTVGETRQPRDLAVYESLTSGGTRSVKLYDRTSWVELTGLTSGGIAPLSSRDRTGLAACLATSGAFVSMFGGQVSPLLFQKAGSFLKNLMNKSGSTQDEPGGVYF